MKFCRNFADNLENVEIFLKFLNFLGKIPILKEFEWFEWFEWFGPSPIEPFNSGWHAPLHGAGDGQGRVHVASRAAVDQAERSCGRVHFFGGAVWGVFRENANCGDPVG